MEMQVPSPVLHDPGITAIMFCRKPERVAGIEVI